MVDFVFIRRKISLPYLDRTCSIHRTIAYRSISLSTLNLIRSTNFRKTFLLLGLVRLDPSAFYAHENFLPPPSQEILANKKRFHSKHLHWIKQTSAQDLW